jgi:hypothetical protein
MNRFVNAAADGPKKTLQGKPMKHITYLIALALFHSPDSRAQPPLKDFNMKCLARNSAGQTALIIESGVDPSGGFDTWIEAKAPFAALDGIQYTAHARSGRKKDTTLFTSAPYIRPRIVLYVDWSKKLYDGNYHGTMFRKNIKGDQPLDLHCSIDEF